VNLASGARTEGDDGLDVLWTTANAFSVEVGVRMTPATRAPFSWCCRQESIRLPPSSIVHSRVWVEGRPRERVGGADALSSGAITGGPC
jgi:hypothetical protein